MVPQEKHAALAEATGYCRRESYEPGLEIVLTRSPRERKPGANGFLTAGDDARISRTADRQSLSLQMIAIALAGQARRLGDGL